MSRQPIAASPQPRSAAAALAFLAALSAGLLLTCRPARFFHCQSDDQCRLGELQGRCERVGACSFPESSCPSKKRYAELSGDLSGSCVPGDPPPSCTFHVAVDGDDANPGSLSAPFRTLARAIQPLQPGQTLCIHEGTYPEALIHNIPAGSSWDEPVTLAAYPGDRVVLQPGPGAEFVLRFVAPQRYIVVRDLVIDGANVAYDAVKITFTGTGQAIGSAHHIRLVDCEVKNAPEGGLHEDSWDNQFIRVDVHHNGDSSSKAAVYLRGERALLEGSAIHDNAGWGVSIYHEPIVGEASDNLVRGCRIFDNARLGGPGAGITLSSGPGNAAYNNLIWGNEKGIEVDWGAVENRVYHNTVFANRSQGIVIGPGSRDADVRNNIVHANGEALPDRGPGTRLSSNLTSDPGFVDAAGHDFHLLPGSPAIDAGETIAEVNRDFEGNPRPLGAGSDIGAFEHGTP